jgi:hypothetical protein
MFFSLKCLSSTAPPFKEERAAAGVKATLSLQTYPPGDSINTRLFHWGWTDPVATSGRSVKLVMRYGGLIRDLDRSVAV